jgi:hypothetical protein
MAFAAMAFKNRKAMGSLLSLYPWLFWCLIYLNKSSSTMGRPMQNRYKRNNRKN